MASFSLAGKVALVTGASRGIGRATALGLAVAGADVVLTSRKLEALEPVAAEIRGVGRRALPVAAHLGRMEAVRNLVEAATAAFGRIDVLVNNAATTPAMATVLDVEERLWDAVMNLNLKGLYFLSQAVARVMRAHGGGSIINVSSIDGYRPEYMVGPYSIAKAAVLMATKSMALELAPHRIRVNAVAPGPVSTRILDSHWFHLPEDEARAQKAEFARMIPLQHIGEPDEIVGAMVYLASDASSFTTGATIIIDGGTLLSAAPIVH